MDIEKILSGLVRVGTVTDVDNVKHMARVKFQGENFTSGWLYVLQRPGGGVDVVYAGSHNHGLTVSSNGSHNHGGQVTSDGTHNHNITTQADHTHKGTTTTSWMPVINAKVLVVYLPVFNADGFILGGIG